MEIASDQSRHTDKLSSLKILLVQMRKDPAVLPAERSDFVSSSGLADHQFKSLDVFREASFSPEILDEYDALFIGGISDDRSDSLKLAVSDFPFIPSLKRLIQYAADQSFPSLLSCGGFMIASSVLGGKIEIRPEYQELGFHTMYLSEDAKKDPLFTDFPIHFPAVSGHIKSTTQLPPESELLVFSERCPIHAFKLKHAPFYAFQFHPEISYDSLYARIARYKEKYFTDEGSYQQMFADRVSTEVANNIVRRFVELLAGFNDDA